MCCGEVCVDECEVWGGGYGLEVVDGEGLGVCVWECFVYGFEAEVAEVVVAAYPLGEAAPGAAVTSGGFGHWVPRYGWCASCGGMPSVVGLT